MIKQSIPQLDFTYAVGRLRALETSLLNANELERMVLAKDAKDAYKIVNELDYSTHIGDIDSVENFQEVIDAGLRDTKKIMRESIPHRWVLNLIWFRFDFHNIKTLLKAKFSGRSREDVENFLIPLGAANIDDLAAYIFEGETSHFGIWEENAAKIKYAIDAAARFSKNGENIFVADTSLDRDCVNLMADVAKDTGSEFLVNFVAKYADLKNISAIIRLKYYKRHDNKDLPYMLSKHGTIDRGTLVDFGDREMNEFIDYSRKTDYADVVAKAVEGYEADKSFRALEQAVENYLTDAISQAKRISIGPEPVVAYFWAKNNNALTIRMVMVGKLNGLTPEEIKENLHALY